MTPAGIAPHDPAPPLPEHQGPSAAEPAAGRTPQQPSHDPLVPTQSGEHDLSLISTEPGQLLASGALADVWSLDEERVLRRYREGRDASREAHLLRHVVSHGFPAPRVLQAAGPDMLMERLHGPTLLQALTADEVTIPDAAHTMADLHTRLHAIPAPGAAASGSTDVVVHLDLHPANVILTEAHGPMVVGWGNVRAGSAALDIAVTALILAEVAVDAGGLYSRAARAVLASFLAAAGTDPREALDEAASFRAADPTLVPGERELVPAAAELVRHYAELAEHS